MKSKINMQITKLKFREKLHFKAIKKELANFILDEVKYYFTIEV